MNNRYWDNYLKNLIEKDQYLPPEWWMNNYSGPLSDCGDDLAVELGAGRKRSQLQDYNQIMPLKTRSGRLKRAIRRLLDLGPIISTQTVMQWAYSGHGTLRERWIRAHDARRACRSLGLVVVDRVWPMATFGLIRMTLGLPRISRIRNDVQYQ